MNPTKEITQYIFQMRRKIGKQLHTQREMQGLSLSEAAKLIWNNFNFKTLNFAA